MRRENLQIGNTCKVRLRGRIREAKLVAIGGETEGGVFTVTVRSVDGKDYVVASSMIGCSEEEPQDVVLQTIAREARSNARTRQGDERSVRPETDRAAPAGPKRPRPSFLAAP